MKNGIIKINNKKYTNTGFYTEFSQRLFKDKQGNIYRLMKTKDKLATGLISNKYNKNYKQVKFIDYSRDYLRFKTEYDKAWHRININGDLILRKDVEEFESNLAKFVGTKYAIGVSNGTDAIMLCIKYLKANRVLCPSYTFKSTISAVIAAGAKLVFKGQAKVAIVAHISGELSQFPDSKIIIEDACQALGAVKNPKSFAQCWSFYPAKILGCKGDAGAITTNDENFYKWAREARNHFKETNLDWGGNYRMDNLQAALLNVKFKFLPEILKRRSQIAEIYNKKLLKRFFLLPNNAKGRVWQDYIIFTDKRNELHQFLKEHGIETIKNDYPFPIEKNEPQETCGLRLPMNENLNDEEVDYVIETVNKFYLQRGLDKKNNMK